MLDFDLARLYCTETSLLKRAVRRNIERFPEDFMFELTKEEANALLSSGVFQFGTPQYQIGEEALEAINDLSEDNRKEFDSIYLALSQLADKQKLINKPRNPIGFRVPKSKE